MRSELSRRHLLASGAAVGLFASAADVRPAIAIPRAPVARKAIVRVEAIYEVDDANNTVTGVPGVGPFDR